MIKRPWRRSAILGVCLLTALGWFLSFSGIPEVTAAPPPQAGQEASGNVLPAQAQPLLPFLEALFNLEQNLRKVPVTIIQLGDSHTAGGQFCGALRELFQDRFGAAGRGALPPGRPFRYYNPNLVEVAQSKDWSVLTSRSNKTEGPFGLSGFRLKTSAKGANMSVTSLEDAGFDRLELSFLGQPQGGTLTVHVDNTLAATITTKDNQKIPRRLGIDMPRPGRKRLRVTAGGDGPVELLSWAVQRDRPGIILDSHGVVGATIDIMDRWDPKLVASELKDRDPSLIIVQYGSNEGFDDTLDPNEYRETFRRNMKLLRRSAPRATVLVLGPVDGNRLPDYCRDKAPKKGYPCAPLSPEEMADYTGLLKKKSPRLCRWHPPPNLTKVRKIQQEVANQEGCVFWDWLPLTKGECGIHQWSLQNPSLAFADHLHLKPKGYQLSAQAVFQDLMYYYDQYRLTRLKKEGGAP